METLKTFCVDCQAPHQSLLMMNFVWWWWWTGSRIIIQQLFYYYQTNCPQMSFLKYQTDVLNFHEWEDLFGNKNQTTLGYCKKCLKPGINLLLTTEMRVYRDFFVNPSFVSSIVCAPVWGWPVGAFGGRFWRRASQRVISTSCLCHHTVTDLLMLIAGLRWAPFWKCPPTENTFGGTKWGWCRWQCFLCGPSSCVPPTGNL